MEHHNTIIEARGVTKVFNTGRGEVRAINGVDLDIYEGEYLSVMGPSGSGKSTLFNMIGALDRPTGGTVEIGGVFLGKINDREAAFFRSQHMGYIFQAYNLIPSLTALKNVALPVALSGATTEEALRRATLALEEVGLGDRLTHRPDELSGGQQQRVAIARAIVNKPSILLADEPTANLDLHTGEQIIELLRGLCNTHGVTVITATHDHAMLAVSNRVVWIADGKIERIAKSSELRIKTGTVA
jgi:putative ABC transport system ATP-binding protein